MKIAYLLPGPAVSGGIRVTVVSGNMMLDRRHDVRMLYRRELWTGSMERGERTA